METTVDNLRILLADDEKIVHLTIGDYLSDCGHQVDSAVDGARALEAIEKNRYDVVIADVRMPGLDGLSLLTRARKLHPGMPVIVITGHGDVDMEDEATLLGAAGFLLKPGEGAPSGHGRGHFGFFAVIQSCHHVTPGIP